MSLNTYTSTSNSQSTMNSYLNAQGFSRGGIFRKIPSFLKESEFSPLSDSDRVEALAHRVASIVSLESLEEGERSRRAYDAQGETSKRALAAQTSALLKGSQLTLRQGSRSQRLLSTTKFQFFGGALGSRSSWQEFCALEELERSRRLSDVSGEALKRTLAANYSARLASEWSSIKLRRTYYKTTPLAYMALEEQSQLAASLEHGIDVFVDSAKSLGGLAVRAAEFFGHKALLGAQNLASQAAAQAPYVKKQAKQLGGAALEIAREGAHIAGEKAALGAHLAKEGAIIAGEKAIVGAQNLAGQAQDLAAATADKIIDAWQDYIYTLSWSQLTVLEEAERAWRMDSALSLNKFMLAMDASLLIKEYIRTNDAAFYQPRRHYGTAVLEEYERIRRLLEFRSDKSARNNANLTATLIKAQFRKSQNAQPYNSWVSNQSGQGLNAPSQLSIKPANSTARLMSMAQLQNALPSAQTQAQAQGQTQTLQGQSQIQSQTQKWGTQTQSQWQVNPNAQNSLSAGTIRQLTGWTSRPTNTWKPTPAAELLQMAAQQQLAQNPSAGQYQWNLQQGQQLAGQQTQYGTFQGAQQTQGQQGLQQGQQGLQQAQGFGPKPQGPQIQQVAQTYVPAM